MRKLITKISLGSAVIAIPIVATVSCGAKKINVLESKMQKASFHKLSYEEREQTLKETFFTWYGVQNDSVYKNYYKPFSFIFPAQTAAAGINTPKPISGDYIGDIYAKEGTIRMEVIKNTGNFLNFAPSNNTQGEIINLKIGDIIEISNLFGIEELFEWDSKNKIYNPLPLTPEKLDLTEKIKITILNKDLIKRVLAPKVKYEVMVGYNYFMQYSTPEKMTAFNLYEFSKGRFKYKEGQWT